MSKKSKFSPAEKYKVALEAIKGELTQAQITSSVDCDNNLEMAKG